MIFPPLTKEAYAAVTCKGVVVMPWPNEIVSNLHLFQSNFIGLPTSSSWISGLSSNLVSLINVLNFFSPTFLAINNVPTLDDLINISSTERFLGNSLTSEILNLEQFIDLGIFFKIVFGVTRSFSNAIAIVKVLKIDPNS